MGQAMTWTCNFCQRKIEMLYSIKDKWRDPPRNWRVVTMRFDRVHANTATMLAEFHCVKMYFCEMCWKDCYKIGVAANIEYDKALIKDGVKT